MSCTNGQCSIGKSSAAAVTSPDIGKAPQTNLAIAEDYGYLGSSRVRMGRADPSAVSMGNFTHNPQCEASACGGSAAGCSTAVNPIPTFLPILYDLGWAVGLVALIESLFEDDYKTKFKRTETLVQQTIDMNDYLPSTIDGFDRSVVGTGV